MGVSDDDSNWLPSGDETLWSIGEALVGATVAVVAFNLASEYYPGTVIVPFAVAIVVGLVVANLVKQARLRVTR